MANLKIPPVQEYKKVLFPYAYNILGSSEDAKDAIQDVLSDYLAIPKEGIKNEKGYLIKSVINHSINVKKRRKKLSYGEVWLPEPVATEEADTNLNLRDIVSYSLLVLLEQLNPKERAVFILKEGFEYSHEEISEVLSSTVENSRKLLSRAKSKLKPSQQPIKIKSQDKLLSGILENYIQAIRARDTHTLESLLSQDIAFFADGGANVPVFKKRCTGLFEVVDLLMFTYHKYQTTASVILAEFNHQPALLYYKGSDLTTCQVFDISPTEGNIRRINTILDPEKLKSIQRNQEAIPLKEKYGRFP